MCQYNPLCAEIQSRTIPNPYQKRGDRGESKPLYIFNVGGLPLLPHPRPPVPLTLLVYKNLLKVGPPYSFSV